MTIPNDGCNMLMEIRSGKMEWVSFGISIVAIILSGVAIRLRCRHIPLRIRAIELHSQELKDTSDHWINGLRLPEYGLLNIPFRN